MTMFMPILVFTRKIESLQLNKTHDWIYLLFKTMLMSTSKPMSCIQLASFSMTFAFPSSQLGSVELMEEVEIRPL